MSKREPDDTARIEKEVITEHELEKARAEITRLRADVERLTREVDSWRKAEGEISTAYVRLRAIIPGAFDTPTAPTGPQIWSITETAAQRLRAERDSLESRLRAAVGARELLWSALQELYQASCEQQYTLNSRGWHEDESIPDLAQRKRHSWAIGGARRHQYDRVEAAVKQADRVLHPDACVPKPPLKSCVCPDCLAVKSGEMPPPGYRCLGCGHHQADPPSSITRDCNQCRAHKPATERDEKPVFSGERCSEIIVKSPPTALLREVYEKAMRGKRHLGLFLPEWHDAHEVYADLRDVLQKLAPYVERREG